MDSDVPSLAGADARDRAHDSDAQADTRAALKRLGDGAKRQTSPNQQPEAKRVVSIITGFVMSLAEQISPPALYNLLVCSILLSIAQLGNIGLVNKKSDSFCYLLCCYAFALLVCIRIAWTNHGTKHPIERSVPMRTVYTPGYQCHG